MPLCLSKIFTVNIDFEKIHRPTVFNLQLWRHTSYFMTSFTSWSLTLSVITLCTVTFINTNLTSAAYSRIYCPLFLIGRTHLIHASGEGRGGNEHDDEDHVYSANTHSAASTSVCHNSGWHLLFPQEHWCGMHQTATLRSTQDWAATTVSLTTNPESVRPKKPHKSNTWKWNSDELFKTFYLKVTDTPAACTSTLMSETPVIIGGTIRVDYYDFLSSLTDGFLSDPQLNWTTINWISQRIW